jgi:hypothetical protein
MVCEIPEGRIASFKMLSARSDPSTRMPPRGRHFRGGGWRTDQHGDANRTGGDLWAKAQARKARFPHYPPHVQHTPRHLFSGLVRCGLLRPLLRGRAQGPARLLGEAAVRHLRQSPRRQRRGARAAGACRPQGASSRARCRRRFDQGLSRGERAPRRRRERSPLDHHSRARASRPRDRGAGRCRGAAPVERRAARAPRHARGAKGRAFGRAGAAWHARTWLALQPRPTVAASTI